MQIKHFTPTDNGCPQGSFVYYLILNLCVSADAWQCVSPGGGKGLIDSQGEERMCSGSHGDLGHLIVRDAIVVVRVLAGHC